jgi:hypothetical protein
MEKYDLLVDAALDSYPVSPTPPGFTRRVMAQIRREQSVRKPASRPGGRFHLEFLDLALPAFFAGFAGLGFIVLLGVIALLNPLWLLRAQLQIRTLMYELPWLWGAGLAPLPVLPIWVFVLAGFGFAVLGLGLLLGMIWLSPVARRLAIR